MSQQVVVLMDGPIGCKEFFFSHARWVFDTVMKPAAS